MRKARLILVVLLVVNSAAFAKSTSPRTPLGGGELSEIIRAAIYDNFGRDVDFEDDEDVVILGNTNALSFARVIVERLSIDCPGEKIELRLRCEDRACLPFYVLVTPRRFSALNQDFQSTCAQPSTRAQARSDHGAAVMPAGSRAILVLNMNNMRLSIPVISLESRNLGEPVRVQSLDSRRVIRAVVHGPGLAVVQEPQS